MKILELLAENYKRLRVVEINPTGRMVQITGKNGQGKTSVLDAIWSAIVGAKAIPEKPVRKGADRARIRLDLGDFVITRTIKPDGEHSLTVENAKGTKVASPQKILDELMGELTFDPLAFVQMKPKEQVEMLRKVAKIEIDVDALNEASKADYDNRRLVNRDIESLRTQVATITVQDGLPKEKLDETAILRNLQEAGEKNRQAQEQARMREKMRANMDNAGRAIVDNENAIATGNDQISKIESQIRELQKARNAVHIEIEKKVAAGADLKNIFSELQKGYELAPAGDLVDVGVLTMDLQTVQLRNREIDKRNRKEALEKELKAKEREAETLTRAIEDREEQKRSAIQNAAMPVPGLSFDENHVLFNGIPIGQLGEAEQIRVSTSVAMAANPTLRVIRILNGEALDEDNLKVLAEMAEQNDFQIWMAKVDSSGKCGIVMEDGMVKATMGEAE